MAGGQKPEVDNSQGTPSSKRPSGAIARATHTGRTLGLCHWSAGLSALFAANNVGEPSGGALAESAAESFRTRLAFILTPVFLSFTLSRLQAGAPGSGPSART